MQELSTVSTPAAVVDLERLRRSCEAMRALANRHEVRLRPHVKTHKCVEAALVQCDGVGPITVSTLAEARCFFAAGFVDLLWAVPCPHPRVAEAVQLVASGLQLTVLADAAATVSVLDTAARARGVILDVMLKVDSGGARAGVSPDSDDAVALAREIAGSRGLRLAGLLTHAGQSYGCRSRDEAATVAVTECHAVRNLAERLRARGIDPGVLSVGSTPTVRAWDQAFVPPGTAGVDEIRPGNYAFFDQFQVGVGSCTAEEVGLTVVASVVGLYPDRATAVLDAGLAGTVPGSWPSTRESGVRFRSVAESPRRAVDWPGVASAVPGAWRGRGRRTGCVGSSVRWSAAAHRAQSLVPDRCVAREAVGGRGAMKSWPSGLRFVGGSWRVKYLRIFEDSNHYS